MCAKREKNRSISIDLGIWKMKYHTKDRKFYIRYDYRGQDLDHLKQKTWKKITHTECLQCNAAFFCGWIIKTSFYMLYYTHICERPFNICCFVCCCSRLFVAISYEFGFSVNCFQYPKLLPLTWQSFNWLHCIHYDLTLAIDLSSSTHILWNIL